MGEFLTPLIVEKVEKDLWRLLCPLIFVSDRLGRIEVPVGFKYDGASVPRIGWVYAMFGNTAWRASAVHDYGYRVAPVGTRADWDYVFLEGMIAEDSPSSDWARYAMHEGVVLGGGPRWEKYRAEQRRLV